MEENHIPQPPQPATRPLLLSILCILTFISSSIGAMSCIFTPMFAEPMIAFTSQQSQFKDLFNEQALTVIRGGWLYYMILLLLTSISFTGALMMWNLRKNGFHLYALANIFIYCLPSFMLGIPFIITGLMFPGIFIALYAMHLKFMN